MVHTTAAVASANRHQHVADLGRRTNDRPAALAQVRDSWLVWAWSGRGAPKLANLSDFALTVGLYTLRPRMLAFVSSSVPLANDNEAARRCQTCL